MLQESFQPIEASSQSQNNRETEPQGVMEEFLERERKNSKNEINAKLNNRGNFDVSIFDGKKPFTDDDNNRKIRRIDLQAYGFANHFADSHDCRRKPPRVVNKLDLRSYGYDSGLRRTQSNNHIDNKVNNSFITTKLHDDGIVKSNLTQNQGRLDYIWTQSTEDLNERKEIIFDKLGGMTAAKSVPNIAKSYAYNGNKTDRDVEIHVRPNGSTSSYDSDSQNSRTESAEELPRKLSISKDMKYSLESLEADRFADAALPMPSVKRLAETFNTVQAMPARIINKTDRTRHRPITPEVQIIKTPRQMHSLTARSIPREFREGLRQISCKPNAQPVHSTIIEQSKAPAASAVSRVSDHDNTKLIASGNLRNSIQFWEQQQRKP